MSGNKSIYIKAFPRIHATLIGMSKKGLRINGGIGFSISDPFIEIIISDSESFQLIDNRHVSMDSSQRKRLNTKLKEIKHQFGFHRDIKIVINGFLPTHSGFGSGTIIRLASIEGLCIINNHNYDRNDLIKMSGRGGTSGVGIRTYFQGGYIFDIGHKNSGQELLPSSNRENAPIQTLSISEGPMPDWNVGICHPTESVPMRETEEQFFLNNDNLKDATVYETLYYVIYGVLAGIKENDKDLFEKGVNGIQLGDWKKAEIELYFDELRTASQILYENGASMVGITSLGPGLFFSGTDLSTIIIKSKQKLNHWSFFNASTNNSGRILIVENA